MSKILVVDDKEMMRDSVATTLARKGHVVSSAAGANAALKKLSQHHVDAVITDLQMPDMDGLELLGELRRIDEHLPVILMTAYGTVETAVEAMKQGAFDYITKPFSGDALTIAVERGLEHGRLLRENQILRAVTAPADAPGGEAPRAIIGNGSVMDGLMRELEQVADSHGTVLISGESGAGKEVAARWIHEHSPRASMPLLAINCAALSTSLLESELFGHEKGAFTGADKLRKGRFEIADGGTLLLDEISEIAPEIQAKLLRVLQERTFERVGSSTSRSVDVRVIATTNRDLTAEVADGSFRQDLFFRLNVLPLTMPPLRDRREDIPPLATHFLEQVARREGKQVKSIDETAMALLQSYSWPGNVRELQNICERAAVLTPGDAISAMLIAPWLDGRGEAWTANRSGFIVEPRPMPDGPAHPCPGIICDGSLTLDDVEREAIVATLQHNNGHRQRSASALGIGVRTLGLKLKKWKEQHLVANNL